MPELRSESMSYFTKGFYPMLKTGQGRVLGINADFIVSFLDHPKSPHMVMQVFVCLSVHPEVVSQHFAMKILGDVEEANDEMTKEIVRYTMGILHDAIKQGGRVINNTLVCQPRPMSYQELKGLESFPVEVHLVGLA